MDKELLSKYRSDVIEKFINIETIVNSIICQHYFKKIVMNFFFEILYDEYFSFGFKRKVLEKIIKKPDHKKIDDLNRLSNIRNHFAHRNQEIVENKPGFPSRIPDPKNFEIGIDFESLYAEFLTKEKEVVKYLADIFLKLGGIMETGPPH